MLNQNLNWLVDVKGLPPQQPEKQETKEP